MWGDHLQASLIKPYHISTSVRTVLAFFSLHLPRNDTIPRILRNRRHIFLHRRVWCKCSFCQHRSGFCNYSTDRLKSWISVNAMFYIFFFIRKLKSREILVKQAYNVTIVLYMCLISPISCVRLMNEWQSVDRSQSRVACRDFLELWLLKKTKKNSYF